MTEPFDTLHLYAQQHQHDHAMLVGTRGALERLRDALNAALIRPSGYADPVFFCTDGEGYEVEILLESEAGMEGYAMPYTSEYAAPADTPAYNVHWPKKPGSPSWNQ